MFIKTTKLSGIIPPRGKSQIADFNVVGALWWQ